MKKSKFLVLGLIALMLAGGLVLASCGSKCSGDGECIWKIPTDAEFAAGATEGLPTQCADQCVGKQAMVGTAADMVGKTYKCDC
jgi:hypothetical protein